MTVPQSARFAARTTLFQNAQPRGASMHPSTRLATLAIALAFALAAPALPAATAATDAKAKDAKAATKVSEADARKTALASVPSGTVQSSKLVSEKGRQVWAFDLKSPTSPNVFKVQVDAESGRIVSKSIQPAGAAGAAKTDKSKS